MSAPLPYVLNVIAEKAGALASRLSALGKPDWLSEDRAFDIALHSEPKAALDEARALAKDFRADINIVPALNRRKKLLVADMDSTIIGCECIDELADFAGIKAHVAAITERAMRGELDFPDALRERVALLKGLPLEQVARVYAERVRLNPGARALTQTMRANGAHTFLVSGGFTYFTARVAEAAGFEHNQGNVLENDGSALTGTVGEPILGREAKLAALEKAAAQFGIDPDATLAVGDGANDLDMIRRAGLGVAYHAKPVVAEAAGAAITYGTLTGLLYLQGYRDAEIVTG